jgi:hypothetical protein
VARRSNVHLVYFCGSTARLSCNVKEHSIVHIVEICVRYVTSAILKRQGKGSLDHGGIGFVAGAASYEG